MLLETWAARPRPKKRRDSYVFARHPEEWYVEPRRVTTALLAVERFEGAVHDPACGGGNIVRAALAVGLEATGADIIDRAGSPPWFEGRQDFLKSDRRCINVVMNPPFFRAKGTEAFVRHALALAERKVALFCDYRFLMSGRRARGLFVEHPPTRVWLCADRPSCPPGTYLAAGGEAKGGTPDYCWIVWERGVGGPCVLDWLK